MADRNNHSSRPSITRRLASHGELIPTAEFTERLLEQLREKIRTSSPDAQPSRRWKSLRIRIPLATAAGLLIVLGCLWAFFSNSHTASANFGDMLRNIRQAQTVAYTVSIQVAGEDTTTIRTYHNKAGQMRQDYNDGKTIIMDLLIGKRLILSASKKQATFYSYDASSACSYEPLDIVKDLTEPAGTFIRYETHQGRRAAVYEAACEDGVLTIWIDREENFPVRLVRRFPPADNQREMIYTMDHFQWNLPIPPETFSMEIPEGYQLEQPERDATEEDMIFLFRHLGEKNGVFPIDTQLHTIFEALFVQNEDAQTHEVTENIAVFSYSDSRSKTIKKQCLHGFYFIKRQKKAGAFHYLGKGVSMGDASAIVCYLDSPEGKTFRVIYGDLSVKDYPVENKSYVLGNPSVRK